MLIYVSRGYTMNKKLIIPALIASALLAGCTNNQPKAKLGSLSGSKILDYISVTPIGYEIAEGVTFELSYVVTNPDIASLSEKDRETAVAAHSEFDKCAEGTHFYRVERTTYDTPFGIIFSTNINSNTLRFDFYKENVA